MYHESRGKDEDQQANYHHQHQQIGTSPRVITSSPSSSPSHEFSFTISLNPNSSYYTKEISEPNRTKSFTSSFIDLSPADDIFYHGQLLPLHHLSHFPSSISPRSSTTSLESFTLPTHDVFSSEENHTQTKQDSFEHQRRPTLVDQDRSDDLIRSSANQYQETRLKANTVQKSLTFFGLQKWRKGCEEMKENETEDERQQRTKRKLKFDTLKRYIRMVRPFLPFRTSSRREGKIDEFKRQTYSLSGIKRENRMRMDMGYSSAPASIWTSPTNSGHLVATPETFHSSTSDSTMEELQAAIQAAIAHCKNSIAIQHDNKNP
ncbi:hypothetical protein Leryth_013481 [Lithospermum erythrorhizon]|nr:hypothetical protein Leryth_013481 [Lithospermum erythrorhizon]